MTLRLLDEVLEMGGRGVALLWMASAQDVKPYAGMKLRDARGNMHQVASVSDQGELMTLYLPDGNADYFGRLFRDIRVDATLFEEVR